MAKEEGYLEVLCLREDRLAEVDRLPVVPGADKEEAGWHIKKPGTGSGTG